ncbi:MAG: ABC transporter ATP-binding protein [Nocardioides sp.]|uniref:ABC transporter ATP-binding protein n=1 Tax=Nocardioides sp. TaxID=35761 RepID=UPI0039E531B3
MSDPMPSSRRRTEAGIQAPSTMASQDAPAGTEHRIGGPFIVLDQVCKTFPTLDTTVVAADQVSLEISDGTSTALTGPSGSGKSTLLHLIAALDTPDSGSITVGGQTITELSRKQLPGYRRTIGIVFQRFNLLPALTVLDNVMAPLMPRKADFDVPRRARELLEAVGLAGRDNTFATRLSGGQQQRVAIARALINDPQLILADEPTGNLDSVVGTEIADLLLDLVTSRGATLLMATHDEDLAARCDHLVHIHDGRIEDQAD